MIFLMKTAHIALCLTKRKTDRPLSILHKGCRLTSSEIRAQIAAAQIRREEKKEHLKKEKEKKKQSKNITKI